MCQREKDVVHAMVGNGEQMRMWGGWKGLPLPASHWPGMTTFSPEAPSSLLPSILLSSPLSSPLPPSVFTSLPLLLSSRHPHHNRSISYSVSNLDVEEKSCFGFFTFFSPLHFHLPWMPAWSFFSPSVPSLLSSLPPTPLPPPSPLFCWLAMYFSNTLPLSTTQTSAMEPPLLAVSC